LSKRYFDILEIETTTDKQIIKKAYRRLAVQLHPDKNPDPQAGKRFLEITEAYDYLIGKASKKKAVGKQYSYSDFSQVKKPSGSFDYQERMRQAKKRYEYLKAKEAYETEQYYQKIAKGKAFHQFRYVLYGCTIMALIFILDYSILPTHFKSDFATHGNRILAYGGIAENRVVPVYTINEKRFWIRTSFFGAVARNQELQLERTFFFKDVKYIWVFDENQWIRIPTDFSVMGTFPIVPLFLLIPLITYFARGRTLTYSVLFNFSFYFFGTILILLLYLNDRWIHLLTLGLL